MTHVLLDGSLGIHNLFYRSLKSTISSRRSRVLKFQGSKSSGSAISLDLGPYGIHDLHKSRLWHYDRPDLLGSVKPIRPEIQLWAYLNFENNNFPNNIVENQYILRQLHFSLLEKTLILLETLNWA